MKVYTLDISTGTAVDILIYLTRERAETHKMWIETDVWGIHRPGDKVAIRECDISSIANQTVKVCGDDIGYMFSDRYKQGRRTFTRTVRQLTTTSDGVIVGSATIKGRTIYVRYWPDLDYWTFFKRPAGGL